MRLPFPVLATTLALAFTPTTRAQTPRLLIDLNTEAVQEPSSDPDEAVQFGGYTYFSAQTIDTGRELFRTAAAPGTAELFADLVPGPSSSWPRSMVVFNGRLWFSADRQLWSTDGTPAGTQSIKSFLATPDELTVLGGTLFFKAGDTWTNTELWRTDGTVAGTIQVADIHHGPLASGPTGITAFAGRVYFGATDGIHGRELWVSDGTAAGTQMVRDIAPGSAPSAPQVFAVLGSHLYFLGQDRPGNAELWRTDGTEAGTQLVHEIRPGPAGSVSINGALLAAGGALYFFAHDGVNGQELWCSDGTAVGTRMVRDIGSGSVGASPPIVANQGRLFFLGIDAASGAELWMSDGTETGTVMVADLNPGAAGSLTGGIGILGPFGAMQAFGTGVVVGANDGTRGHEPWFSDGLSMQLLADIHPGAPGSNTTPIGLGPSGSTLLFAADDGILGDELYGTDGSGTGTQLWADLHQAGPDTQGSNPHNLRDAYGQLFFAADDGLDLPGETTPWIAEVHTGSALALASVTATATTTAVTLGGNWVFEGQTSTAGREPWRSDGTAAGTVLLGDLQPGSRGSGAQFPTVIGAHVMIATERTFPQLWRTDGIAIAGFGLPYAARQVRRLVDLHGQLLFLDPPGYYQYRPTGLWSSDGTVSGTAIIAHISGAFRIAVGAAIGFIGVHPNFSQTTAQLWRTDGTTPGTELIADLAARFDGPRLLTGTQRGMFFVLRDRSTTGSELWFSDGTTAGTQLVVDLEPGTTGSGPDDLTPFGDGVLFTAQTSGFGRELWFSDGSAAGTHLVIDLNPGATSSDPSEVVAIGTRHAVFGADDGTLGRELWITDGTPGNARPLADVRRGASGSDPREPTLCAGQVVFSADDGVVGRELWVVDPGATAQTVGLGCGPRGVRRPELTSDDPVLGTLARVETRAGEPGSAAALLLGPPRRGLPWAGDCFLFLDPAGTVLLSSALLTTGHWDVAIPVPLIPTLEGLRVGLQVALAPTGGGIELTNGVFWTLSPR
ncbi:MAG: ELWxxDGT repeat protein [Planctomycetota bacterium]